MKKSNIVGAFCALFLLLGNSSVTASVFYQLTPTTGTASGLIEFATPPADSGSGWVSDVNDVLMIDIEAPPSPPYQYLSGSTCIGPDCDNYIGSNTGQQLDSGVWFSIGCAALQGSCTTLTFSTDIGGDAILWSDSFGQHYEVYGDWTVVPIPPAVWLFGSGLLGLIGVARRKKS